MNNSEYWNIINELNWKGRCEEGEYRPYETIGEIIATKYPEHLIDLREFVSSERTKLIQFLSSNNIRTGNDSGWDLTAHIIGCGFDYLNLLKDKVTSGEYDENSIYHKVKYKENFQYSFSKAMESLLGSNDDELYKEWLRDNKIDSLID